MPVSLGPCWLHMPPERVNAQAAPTPEASPGPPIIAVLPSAERDTDEPCLEAIEAPDPYNLLPCWLQLPAVRTNTQEDPLPPRSPSPPTMAVLPSAEIATEEPCWAYKPPVPTSLLPCWLHMHPVRINIQAALSPGPPTMAVLPSAETATEIPCWGTP